MVSLTELTQQLIACPSITPEDMGCQTILIKHLQDLGFCVEQLPFGKVSNFWARSGKNPPLFVFAGHTDVVPAGPLSKWKTPPFNPTVCNGFLYGRGSADMKASLAAMLVACKNFIHQYPSHTGSIAWLVTSDEEGPSINGTAKVTEILKNRKEKIDYCLVGEPTCEEKLGDTLKIGRRGSLSARLIIYGKQGHIAYPHLAKNPIHLFNPVLRELLSTNWDDLICPDFEPTSLQLSNIQAGIGVENVIPGSLEAHFNLRYSPLVTATKLKNTIINILKKYSLSYKLIWEEGGLPFLSSEGRLRSTCQSVIKQLTGISPSLSTTGGTSDARFLISLGGEIVEFGPCNRCIHQPNEYISLVDLEQLALIYEEILKKTLLV